MNTFQGKRHKAKEKALRAQKMLQKNSTKSLPKGPKSSGKPIRLAETRVTSSSELEVTAEEKSLQINKMNDGSDQTMEDGVDLDNRKSDFLKKENENAVNKKKNGVSTAGKVEKTFEARRKKFKFWCETCRVGAYSEVVMETHTNGKKHMHRIQKPKIHEAVPNNKTRTSVPTNMIASPEPTEKGTDVGAARSPEPIEKASDVDAVDPTEKASDVDTIPSPVHSEKASDLDAVEPTEKSSDADTIASLVRSEKSSNVTVASPEHAEKASDIVADASAECAEKSSNLAAVASPEHAEKPSDVAAVASAESATLPGPAEKTSEVATAAALLCQMGMHVI